LLGGAFFGVVALSLAYWYYLNHVSHGRVPSPAQVRASAPATASPKPSRIEDPSAALPPALKQAANTGAIVIGTYLVEAVKLPQPAPEAIPLDPVPAQAVPVAAPAPMSFKVVSAPPPQRTTRVLTPEQKLNRAAQIAMNQMLKHANNYPDAYGFLPDDDFATVKLGKAIPVYAVEENDRASYKSGAAVKPLLKPTQQWVFPVLAGDRICCMVRVSFNGHEYIPAGATKALALAWNKINAKWPEAEGFHPLLVVNPEIPGFFFTVPELPTPNLTDADQMLYHRPNLSPADVILASWR
jgi:hypothetical protein